MEVEYRLSRFVEDLGVPSSYRDRNYVGSDEDFAKDMASTCTLYVGNLSFYTSEEQLYALFGKCGPVKRIILGLDRNKKTPCGFCFVEYEELTVSLYDRYFLRIDAIFCKQILDGSKLDDRFIRVDLDPGFREGRQYGRGISGGQVRDEHRVDYDAGRGGWGRRVVFDRNEEDKSRPASRVFFMLRRLVHSFHSIRPAFVRAGRTFHVGSRCGMLSKSNPISGITQIRLYGSMHLNQSETEERVLQVLRVFDKVDSAKLSLTAPFTELGLDSLDVVEVMIALEDEFHMEIPDPVADKVQTPKEVAGYIYNFLNPPSAPAHEAPYSEKGSH